MCQQSKHFLNKDGELKAKIITKKPMTTISSDIVGPIIDKNITETKKSIF